MSSVLKLGIVGATGYTGSELAMFTGTKEAIRVSNLRKLDQGNRPPFLAPAGHIGGQNGPSARPGPGQRPGQADERIGPS